MFVTWTFDILITNLMEKMSMLKLQVIVMTGFIELRRLSYFRDTWNRFNGSFVFLGWTQSETGITMKVKIMEGFTVDDTDECHDIFPKSEVWLYIVLKKVIVKCEKVNRTFGPAGQKLCRSGQDLTGQKTFISNLKNYIPLKIVRKIFITKY